MHEDEPVFAWYFPSEQLAQLAWPFRDWEVPVPQLAHALAFPVE